MEGCRQAPIPKIEIFRSAVGPAPIAATAPHPEPWVALLSDVPVPQVSCPVLRFTDTMWLQLLASIV